MVQFRERYIQRQLTEAEQIQRGDFVTQVNERVVKPYLLDLEAKTILNGEEIEPARYYELLEKDVLKVGDREYVLMSR